MKALVLSLISIVFVGSIALADVGSVGILNRPPPYPPAPYPPAPYPPGNNNVITVYTIPATTKSCYARASYQNVPDDISAKHFQIDRFGIFWGDTRDDLYVTLIRLEFSHPLLKGGTVKRMIVGEELSAMSGRQGGWNGWIPRAYPGTQSRFDANCGPIVGNIAFERNGDVSFRATGWVTVVGFRRDYRGNEAPVSFGAPLDVINQGPF